MDMIRDIKTAIERLDDRLPGRLSTSQGTKK
jgi:hypothetical protein